MKALYAAMPFTLLLASGPVLAQCGAGEVDVTIGITTDTYGYETYWQLVPGGNDCGVGTIFEGGNPTMDCLSGGLEEQDPQGYSGDTTYVEGPWCLTEGALYTIYMIDDYGDGQAGAEVFVNGISVAQFEMGQGPLNIYTFSTQGPLERDMGVTALTTALFAHVGEPVRVRGSVKSFGSQTVSSFDLNYSIDGGTPMTMPVTGVSLTAGDTYEFAHDIPWVPNTEGMAQLVVSVSNISGGEDMNSFNDQMATMPSISPAIPDLAENYLAAEPIITMVANSDQDVLVPRDLAFHPEAGRNELWVLNKDTEAEGGSTVTFYDAGEPDQTFEWRRDVNAWHFMSVPTGIAMGDNNNFATSPGVFDANHTGGQNPFTGPTLWSADTSVYCRYYGGLGSHLDMLHRDPNSQGIAHDFWNRYWVVDGFTGDIVMNDFRVDHGPGNDFHGNGIIRRYADFTITRDPADHIVSHDVLDKATGWLYVVDNGGQRVLRMNVNTGTVSGPATQWDYEAVLEYSTVTGYEWEAIITEGLDQPAGIEVVGTHLYVSDHANGDIIIYDISGSTVPELGRIHTNTPGLMGITVGPDGHIWGVNANTHEVLRIDPQDPSALQETTMGPKLRCWPNPADDRLAFEWPTGLESASGLLLRDAAGRVVAGGAVTSRITVLPTNMLASGTYCLEVRVGDVRRTSLVTIAH